MDLPDFFDQPSSRFLQPARKKPRLRFEEKIRDVIHSENPLIDEIRNEIFGSTPSPLPAVSKPSVWETRVGRVRMCTHVHARCEHEICPECNEFIPIRFNKKKRRSNNEWYVFDKLPSKPKITLFDDYRLSYLIQYVHAVAITGEMNNNQLHHSMFGYAGYSFKKPFHKNINRMGDVFKMVSGNPISFRNQTVAINIDAFESYMMGMCYDKALMHRMLRLLHTPVESPRYQVFRMSRTALQEAFRKRNMKGCTNKNLTQIGRLNTEWMVFRVLVDQHVKELTDALDTELSFVPEGVRKICMEYTI